MKIQPTTAMTATAMPIGTIDASNSLADLAARIRIEHEAVRLAARQSLHHAFAAGELLIEAKVLVGYGDWADWLRDHCDVSVRSAQVYMRLARNQEVVNTQTTADLTIDDALNGLATSTTHRLLQRKTDQTKAAFQEVRTRLPSNLHVGDFRDEAHVIPDDSVDLVFTDPPYDRESIPLYEAAAKEAARILKPGGSMVCYCGHSIMLDVGLLMREHLKYYWVGADVHAGGPMARLSYSGIIAGFKPLLWFVKEFRADRQNFIADTVITAREKDTHPWQQALATAEHFIAALTAESGIVVDFFAGGGTTLVAAKKLGRSWHGFEIDPDAAAKIMERLNGAAEAE